MNRARREQGLNINTNQLCEENKHVTCEKYVKRDMNFSSDSYQSRINFMNQLCRCSTSAWIVFNRLKHSL